MTGGYILCMPTVPQCFSALIASGNGQRCNNLREVLRNALSGNDPVSGLPRSVLYKYHKHNFPEQHKQMRQLVAGVMNPFFDGVDRFYFGNDLRKDVSNERTK